MLLSSIRASSSSALGPSSSSSSSPSRSQLPRTLVAHLIASSYSPPYSPSRSYTSSTSISNGELHSRFFLSSLLPSKLKLTNPPSFLPFLLLSLPPGLAPPLAGIESIRGPLQTRRPVFQLGQAQIGGVTTGRTGSSEFSTPALR